MLISKDSERNTDDRSKVAETHKDVIPKLKYELQSSQEKCCIEMQRIARTAGRAVTLLLVLMSWIKRSSMSRFMFETLEATVKEATQRHAEEHGQDRDRTHAVLQSAKDSTLADTSKKFNNDLTDLVMEAGSACEGHSHIVDPARRHGTRR